MEAVKRAQSAIDAASERGSQLGVRASHRATSPRIAETIPYYEQIAVLPARRKAGYRAYDDGAVARLGFVRAAHSVGFSVGLDPRDPGVARSR